MTKIAVPAPLLDVPLSECFPLTDAPKHWPVAAGGRRLHKHTAFRYVSDGVSITTENGKERVRLRAIKVPGCGLMTHPKWISEFVAAINAARLAAGSPEPRPSSRRRAKRSGKDRRAQTARTLARFNLAAGAAP